MNSRRRHQRDTKTFEELTFAEQAKAINIRVVGLERSIRAHMRRADKESRNTESVRRKCIDQIQRLLARL